MEKLKNKIFYTIMIILTFSILTIMTIFNVQKYIEQKNSIINTLNVSKNNLNNKIDDNIPPEKPIEGEEKKEDNVKYMDKVVYTILLDSNNNVKEIINHSNSDINNSKINLIVDKILKSNNDGVSIGCLYFREYSYSFSNGNYLIIVDNNSVKDNMLISLKISLVIFILLEVIIFLISKTIANYISTPVKESFNKQKQFIEDASHELKTPLSVIIASSEALEENPNETKWLNNIKNESNRMNNLITNLLDLASSEYAETYKMQNGNLSKVIELSCLTFDGVAYEKGIKIEEEIEDNIYIDMDEGSIKQLIEILLDNAIKYSASKSTIKIVLKEKNNIITLSVTNGGESIKKGEEEKIFNRFYRTDKSRNRKSGSYGLGLAIAKNIVTNHNGKISASSGGGKTTFKVLLKK
jgi:two-component system, OmpR family, sensor histidine kinase CiaH